VRKAQFTNSGASAPRLALFFFFLLLFLIVAIGWQAIGIAVSDITYALGSIIRDSPPIRETPKSKSPF
jgi:hypothetical protein